MSGECTEIQKEMGLTNIKGALRATKKRVGSLFQEDSLQNFSPSTPVEQPKHKNFGTMIELN